MTLEPITDAQREANKANRLKHAADKADGVTVRLLQQSEYGVAGRFVVVSPHKASSLINSGLAERAE